LLSKTLNLNTGGVEHDSNGGSEALGRQVLGKFSSNSTRVSVSAGDTAPNASDFGSIDVPVSSVDIGDTFPEVEFSIFGDTDTLDLKKRGVLVDISLGSLETSDFSLGV
jgi:hypothetical protein